MLLALYDVRRETPQLYQSEMLTKLGGDLTSLLRFTSELTRLAGPRRRESIQPDQLSTIIDSNSAVFTDGAFSDGGSRQQQRFK